MQYVGDGAGNLIPVPEGFNYLEGTKNSGFVIKNNTDGNEFVWIPVGDIANYQRVAWWRDDWKYSQTLDEATGIITIENADYSWTEAMPEDEQTSISTYGGFYIGRYEAGVKDYTTKTTTKDGTTTWTGYSGDNTKLVIQTNQEVWNYITRDKAKAVAEDLYDKDTDNVTSKLCSSYAWDSALKFIETKNSTYPINSRGGNYIKATGGTGELQKTGYHAVNNIYDMGGNTWEWTTENCSKTGSPYVSRSGLYIQSASDVPAAYRGFASSTSADGQISFRVTLFI